MKFFFFGNELLERIGLTHNNTKNIIIFLYYY